MSDDLSALVLRTRWLGRAHEHHVELGSTNDRAAAWAKDGAPDGALVTADSQTSGRGRLGRAWFSPRCASVYASIVVRPPEIDARWAALGLAVGVGLHAGLAAFIDGLALKWPNDVLHGGRKLAGILCESRVQGGAPKLSSRPSGPEIVVGFGINVYRVDRPAELAAIATSLEESGAVGLDRGDVLASVLTALEPVLDEFRTQGFAAVRERYEAACVSLGREVEVSDAHGGGRRRVFAERLDDDGALRVRPLAGGASERIEAGDVTL